MTLSGQILQEIDIRIFRKCILFLLESNSSLPADELRYCFGRFFTDDWMTANMDPC